HYLVLLENGSHICTCLLHVYSCVLCEHFFAVQMYERGHALFSLDLVPRRLWKEELQCTNVEAAWVGISRSGKHHISPRKKAHANYTAHSQRFYDVLVKANAGHPDKVEQIASEIFQQAILEHLPLNNVKSPPHTNGKGRPKKKRIRNAHEPTAASKRARKTYSPTHLLPSSPLNPAPKRCRKPGKK
ncbi:hypothetical protein BDR26DRAFT_863140, partial [Obelidium mucronatum]